MDLSPTDFLAKVLPDTGVRFVCRLVSSKNNPKGVFVHEVVSSYEHLLQIARKWEAAGSSVYYALAAYDQPTYKEKTLPDGRIFRYVTRGKDSSVVALRCLWEDIDVAKEAVPSYATAKEAAIALVQACKTIGIPIPLVVHSGRGIHAYWPFTRDVSYEEWLAAAELKKAALEHVGVRIDASRSTDVRSVLRPVGIKGSGGNPVRVLYDAGPYDYDDFRHRLQQYVTAHNIHVHALKQAAKDINDELGSVEFPPSSAHKIAEHCAQIRAFRDTGLPEKGMYMHWFFAIGVLKFTVEGAPICHEWSQKDPRYNADEVQTKIDSWSYGPTSCAKFEEVNPSGCQNCPYRGKIKGPLQLGYTGEGGKLKPQETKPTVPASLAHLIDTGADPLDEYEWPPGFGVNAHGKMTVAKEDANGVIQHVPFASTVFLIKDRIRNTDDTKAYRIMYRVRVNKTDWAWREFTLPAALLADYTGFAKMFASYEIFFYGKDGASHAIKLARDYVSAGSSREIRQVQHMGWVRRPETGELENAFVLGKHIITEDSIHPVRMDSKLTSANKGKHGLYTTAGSKAAWLDMVNRIYARDGAEAHQLAILAGFAAPLVELIATDNWRGIPIALTNGGSSGKSTVCQVVSSIYAHPGTLFFKAGEDESTLNAMITRIGLLCNLPIAFDEMTKRKPEEFKGLIYQLPSGSPKDRLDKNGVIIDHGLHWSTLPLITSNEDIYSLLQRFGEHVRSATQVRIFEVRLRPKLTEILWPDVDPTVEIENFILANHGVVGRDWLKFIIKYRDLITDKLLKARSKYTPHNCGLDSDERYYADLLAMIVVTGKLLTKVLGWLHFDMKNLERWMQDVIEENRLRRNDISLQTVQDKIASLIRSSHDVLLKTKYFPIFARGNSYSIEVGYEKPRNGIAMRIATEDKRVFISTERVEEWCNAVNINKHQFINELLAEGYLKATVDLSRRKTAAVPCRVNLGKGTNEVTGQVRCYEFDYDKLFGAEQNTEQDTETVVSIEAAKDRARALA